MRVADCCTRSVAIAPPEETIEKAVARLAESRIGTLIVVDGSRRPLGIVTDRDLALRGLGKGLDPHRTRLEQVMTAPVVWVHEDHELEAALEEMARLVVRRLPVVDHHSELVGILTLDDALLRALPEDSPAGRALRANLS